MNHANKTEPHGPPDNGSSVHAKELVFFDKKTGTRQFEVKAGEDGCIGMDQAVNMLAIYCVARRQMPRDFKVMVTAEEEVVDGLMRRAMKLIRTCSGAMTRLPLSRRQYQVLCGISQDLSNKEIAANLNLSERTVKFHVSAMLEKFGVRGRTALLQEAGNCLGLEGAQGRDENPKCLPASLDAALALTGATGRPGFLIPMARRAGR